MNAKMTLLVTTGRSPTGLAALPGGLS